MVYGNTQSALYLAVDRHNHGVSEDALPTEHRRAPTDGQPRSEHRQNCRENGRKNHPEDCCRNRPENNCRNNTENCCDFGSTKRNNSNNNCHTNDAQNHCKNVSQNCPRNDCQSCPENSTRNCSQNKGKNILDSLFSDKDMLLIAGLMLVLLSESADYKLIIALAAVLLS